MDGGASDWEIASSHPELHADRLGERKNEDRRPFNKGPSSFVERAIYYCNK